MPHRRTHPSSTKPSTSQLPAQPIVSTPSLDPPRSPKRRRQNKEDASTTLYRSQDILQKNEVASLSASVRRNYMSIKNIWLNHFTDTLGSEERALATLQPNAALPKFDAFKAFVCALGRWGVGTVGWSFLSAKVNADCVLNMLDHRQARKTSDVYGNSIHTAIDSLYRKATRGDMTYINQLPSIECYTTCYFCGLSVFKDENASAHFEECYTSAVANMFSKIKEQDSSPMGFESLSHTVSSGRGFKVTNTFCPLCLFDTTLSWDQRMIPHPNPWTMAQHIVLHGKEEGEFRMDKLLYCGFFPWEKDEDNPDANWFSVPDMFTHLHNDHGYKLLACTDPFHYLCSRRKWRDIISEKRDLRTGGVSNTIFYASDIRRIRELLGHNAKEFGTICLADCCRTAEAKATDLAALDRMYEEQNPDRNPPDRV